MAGKKVEAQSLSSIRPPITSITDIKNIIVKSIIKANPDAAILNFDYFDINGVGDYSIPEGSGDSDIIYKTVNLSINDSKSNGGKYKLDEPIQLKIYTKDLLYALFEEVGFKKEYPIEQYNDVIELINKWFVIIDEDADYLKDGGSVRRIKIARVDGGGFDTHTGNIQNFNGYSLLGQNALDELLPAITFHRIV